MLELQLAVFQEGLTGLLRATGDWRPHFFKKKPWSYFWSYNDDLNFSFTMTRYDLCFCFKFYINEIVHFLCFWKCLCCWCVGSQRRCGNIFACCPQTSRRGRRPFGAGAAPCGSLPALSLSLVLPDRYTHAHAHWDGFLSCGDGTGNKGYTICWLK